MPDVQDPAVLSALNTVVSDFANTAIPANQHTAFEDGAEDADITPINVPAHGPGRAAWDAEFSTYLKTCYLAHHARESISNAARSAENGDVEGTLRSTLFAVGLAVEIALRQNSSLDLGPRALGRAISGVQSAVAEKIVLCFPESARASVVSQIPQKILEKMGRSFRENRLG